MQEIQGDGKGSRQWGALDEVLRWVCWDWGRFGARYVRIFLPYVLCTCLDEALLYTYKYKNRSRHCGI